jgi:hypothetical protein
MSETNLGPTVPQQASPQGAAPQGAAPQGTAPQAAQQPAPAPRAEPEPEPTGWVGWIAFAATMMIMLGIFHAFQGLIALFQDEYYLVGRNGLTIHMDFTAWGWTQIVVGLVVVAAGVGLLSGQMWARIVGVLVAVLSAVVNIAFLSAYPIWSTTMVAFDVLVIWALTVHGREMKTVRRDVITYG